MGTGNSTHRYADHISVDSDTAIAKGRRRWLAKRQQRKEAATVDKLFYLLAFEPDGDIISSETMTAYEAHDKNKVIEDKYFKSGCKGRMQRWVADETLKRRSAKKQWREYLAGVGK